MNWSDGNLAALRQYEREQDDLDMADRMLEEAQADFADDLYDAYIEGKTWEVVAEVDDEMMDHSETMLDKMRTAILSECSTSVGKKGAIVHKTYMDLIARACERISERADSMESVDELRGGLRL